MAVTQTKPTGNARNWIQGTVTAVNDALKLGGFLTMGSVAIQLTGTWAGTITFECSLDNLNWELLNLLPSNGTTPVTSATANGIWMSDVSGLATVRARFSTATSGTPVITIKYNSSQF